MHSCSRVVFFCPLVGDSAPHVCFSISTSSVSWCPYACCLSAVTGSLTALPAWLRCDCALTYAEPVNSSARWHSLHLKQRGEIWRQTLRCPFLRCVLKLMFVTRQKTLQNPRWVPLCVFSFRNGLFSFRAEWCRSVSLCCVKAAWTPGRSNLVYSESLLTGCDSFCHFDRVVLHRLFRATGLWFSVPYGTHNQINYTTHNLSLPTMCASLTLHYG